MEYVFPADLPFHSATSLLQCTRFDLRERLRSFHFCLFRVLQMHLHLHSAPDSRCQRFLEVSVVLSLPDCKDRALCLSHLLRLLLCFTYSPEPQCATRPHCYHTLICNLNPKCCISSFSVSTVSTHDSAVISRSPKLGSFSGLCHSRRISASLSSNLCQRVNGSLTV